MASKSGGTIPPAQTVVDANQAMALLDTLHFWSVKRVNRTDGCPGVEVQITHAGRRVRATRGMLVDAVNTAIAKLHGKGASTKLRLVS